VAVRAPPPVPSPSIKKMTPEQRQAFIRAEAARRLEERQQRLGLISPVIPAPGTSVEERLARERAEAAAKASAAEKEAEQREAARNARLASERGLAPTPIPTAAPVAVVVPSLPSAAVVPSLPSAAVVPSPPTAVAKKKAPPPPAPRSAMKSSLPQL
jgi:hypothetical protein